MGQLVFQATLGGAVNLVGPNTASTFNLNVPAVASTIATLAAQTFAGTQTFTVDAVVNGLTVGRGAGAVSSNTAVGGSTLAANTTGYASVAVGNGALVAQTTGFRNVGVGESVLSTNQTGQANTGMGHVALAANTANYNTAVGAYALFLNSTASNSTAVGYQAGYTSTGQRNAFFGSEAGYANTTGESNTYIGRQAGNLMTSGNNNTIIGRYNGNQNSLDIRTGSNYVVLSDGDGNPLAYTYNGATFCLQGAGYPQTGTGITFPATQSASSNANTLDDYEEGTWTPTDGSGAGLSFTSVYGSYTKIGRYVIATFRLTYPTTSSTAAGAISGLPFVTGGQSGVGATAGGGFINYQQTNTAAIYLTLDASGGTKASWYTTGGATILNVTFTGALMAATIVYQTT